METVDRSTIDFIRKIIHELEIIGDWNRRFHWNFLREFPDEKNIESYLEIIFKLESMIEFHLETLLQRQENEILINGKNTKINFKTPLPFYHDVIDITPIYSDAILLEEHKLLVPQESIPNICYLLQIPSTKEGVVVENHNFGYHFHYCKVKKRTLERTNLLLTFDPVFKKTNKKPKPDLFGEYHAEEKNKKIDMETIGDNKRYPIYLVCHDAGQKRGLSNFKTPSNKSKLFITG
ncbi:hypothetical protein ACNAT0_22035 [Escherichia coli]|uniref:hypothetical protein n=1 Tax=Enterobacteriaceae TaxID=543 RepID=UPI001F495516|nr:MULTISPECIES: hypothetical protein [Enterobacteriaceae]MCH6968800.1 hypothetical protein [Escherichia coli]MDX6146416.1 hypothetical protein [Klebsiella sp. KB_Kp057]HCO8062916.1 hypothetical protein [Escherichia coli]